jgi:hypothetical protein
MKSQPRCRSPDVRSNVDTEQEQFLRDVRLTIESYDSAALGEAIREGKRKKAQAETRPPITNDRARHARWESTPFLRGRRPGSVASESDTV